ncbi:MULTISPECIES: hypothetical protein [unclassified Agarivorans]|uniref:hypothetical protein n=1 Tax=unclassified Agarivorans TaxID=2636026 RepID=UPI0026E25F4E|nr:MULTISPECIES: hypothetical protein [unclassified Agarivorans]MDO6687709.1 hypothetical protein [Agarivorans sp. 3_MG-2023]MDO6717290.1 hypothetical protein [Agarivorans sp. 2_MG-2023]
MKRRLIYLLINLFFASFGASAGPIIVQKSSDPNKVDAFELKKELLEQHLWQEQLRTEAQLQWLRELPVGCVFSANGDYQCGLNWYRPYRYQQQQLYIEVPSPQSSAENAQ